VWKVISGEEIWGKGGNLGLTAKFIFQVLFLWRKEVGARKVLDEVWGRRSFRRLKEGKDNICHVLKSRTLHFEGNVLRIRRFNSKFERTQHQIKDRA